MIIDYIGDHNNLVYEESYKHLVPDHFPPRIIYVPYDHVKPIEHGSPVIKRYSDPSIMKNWNKKLVERRYSILSQSFINLTKFHNLTNDKTYFHFRFRRLRLPAIKEPLSEPIAISHQPCGADEVVSFFFEIFVQYFIKPLR